MDNFTTAKLTGNFLEEEFEAEAVLGMMYKMDVEKARMEFGPRFRIAAPGAVEWIGSGKVAWRIVHDGTHGVGVNHTIRPRDQLVVPGAAEAKLALFLASLHGGVHFTLVADIKKAHRRVYFRPSDHGLRCCRSNSSTAESSVWVNRCGTFGSALLPIGGAGLRRRSAVLTFEIWQGVFGFQIHLRG